MKRVTGIGGVFFKSKDPEKTRDWYKNHLDIQSDQYGAMFQWRQANNPDKIGCTVWSPFKDDTDYFDPSEQPFMINYRVDDLEKLLTVLKEEGVKIVGEMESFDYGKFAWIMDPDGNKIELWEPKDEKLVGEPNPQD
jgi:predicted enzyme related to lactoylglutathione lyase